MARVSGKRPGALEIGLFAQAPLIAVGWLAWFSTRGGAGDFKIFRAAGRTVLEGHSPYVKPTLSLLAQNDHFVYPAPFAYPFVPFALIGPGGGAIVFLLVSAVAILASLRLLGVDDWRCFGMALLGAPAFGALGVGAIGPLLLFLAALSWRLRNSGTSGVTVAVAVAAKLFLWPLLIWLLFSRRFRAFAIAVASMALIVGVWALTDPTGLGRYPETLRMLNLAERWKSYSLQTLWLSLKLPHPAVVPLVVAVLGLVVVARIRDDRLLFALTVMLSLLATPLLWMHYLVLLLVPLCLYEPRLGVAWVVPLCLWVTPHPESLGMVWKIAVALAAIALVSATPLRRSRQVVGPASPEVLRKSGRNRPFDSVRLRIGTR